MTISQLRLEMVRLGATVTDDAQLRQWLKWNKKLKRFDRQPSAANAHFLYLASGKVISPRAMRPRDHAQIWASFPVEQFVCAVEAEAA